MAGLKREDLDVLEKHIIDAIDNLDAVYATAEKLFSSAEWEGGALADSFGAPIRDFQKSLRGIVYMVNRAKRITPMRWSTVDNATARVAGRWRLTVDAGRWSLYLDGEWRGDYASEAAAMAMAERNDNVRQNLDGAPEVERSGENRDVTQGE